MVLKALAKLVYDFAFSNRRNEDSAGHLETLLNGITDIDFSHANRMWRYFELSDDERIASGLKGLQQYLPEADEKVNRDIGAYQGGFMRFGAKHNDIYPILANIIRWKLGLPSRVKKAPAATA